MDDSTVSPGTQAGPDRWLLFIHQLPPQPAYLRVKIRRRLSRLGAHPLKNTVYVLPFSEEALEDCQWLRREIEAAGGEAVVWAASLQDGLTDAELASRLSTGRVARRRPGGRSPLPDLSRGRTWVTRRGVGIDRIGSAWLIRKFIDPRARFRFVPPRGYQPRAGELRFDMFDAEFTHEGERCTFEVLLARFGLREPALRTLSELVHDLDCKDGKFARAEAAGLGRTIEGVMAGTTDDRERLDRGAAVFEALYQSFRRSGATS